MNSLSLDLRTFDLRTFSSEGGKHSEDPVSLFKALGEFNFKQGNWLLSFTVRAFHLVEIRNQVIVKFNLH